MNRIDYSFQRVGIIKQQHRFFLTFVFKMFNDAKFIPETPITAQNHLPVILVGGVLGAALLASSVSIVVLVRRFGCGAIFTCSEGTFLFYSKIRYIEC